MCKGRCLGDMFTLCFCPYLCMTHGPCYRMSNRLNIDVNVAAARTALSSFLDVHYAEDRRYVHTYLPPAYGVPGTTSRLGACSESGVSSMCRKSAVRSIEASAMADKKSAALMSRYSAEPATRR